MAYMTEERKHKKIAQHKQILNKQQNNMAVTLPTHFSRSDQAPSANVHWANSRYCVSQTNISIRISIRIFGCSVTSRRPAISVARNRACTATRLKLYRSEPMNSITKLFALYFVGLHCR